MFVIYIRFIFIYIFVRSTRFCYKFLYYNRITYNIINDQEDKSINRVCLLISLLTQQTSRLPPCDGTLLHFHLRTYASSTFEETNSL